MRAITAYDIVNNRVSSEEVNEARSALGLNNRAKQQHSNTDAVDNIDYYVDLDLPSGNLWAKCNVGAEDEEDHGSYFTWKEATKEYQSQMSCSGDWRELLEYCTIRFGSISDGGEKGLVVQSKSDPNKEVFFPAAGYIDSDGELYEPTLGKYLYEDYTYHVMSFNTRYNSVDEISRIDIHDKQKFSLRLIIKKNKDKKVNENLNLGLNKKAKEKHDNTNPIDNFDEFVDLGLPSGIRWAKCNVGATSEEEYGDYYSYKDIESFAKGNIRVPDNTDWTELKRYCTITFETLGDGSKGMKFTSKSDPSKYILLPPAGFDNYGDEYRGSEGHYMLRNIYGYVFNFVGTTGSATFTKSQIFDDSKFSVRLIEYPEKKKKAKKIEESSHLGLNKQAKKKFNDADAVDNVAYIKFEDHEVERICHEHGVYTVEDAASVTTIIDETQWFKPSWFYDHKIKTFNEFKYFTGLKKVEKHAFNFNTTLETITLPSSIETIGFGAFKDCSNLVKVTIQEGLKTIETCAFDNCWHLKRLVFPEGLERIESLIIEGCFNIKSINVPDSVNYIAPTAFNECRESLNTIYISSNHHLRSTLSKTYPHVVLVDPKEVNESASLGLNKQAKQKFSDEDAVNNVAYIQFEDPEVERICHEHGVYTISDAESVTNIKDWFKVNKTIKSFNEFKYFTGLKEIEDDAFYNCSSLQSIHIPNSITSIGNYVFYNCSSLQSINMPNSVVNIEKRAFMYCMSLQSISISDSVTSIEDSAFYNCPSLQSINIPNSVTRIGIDAFSYCTSLRSIYISKNCPVYDKIRKAYPAIQLIEPKVNESSNLGLNNKAKQKFNDVDAVENVSQIQFEDPEVERICHEHGVYTVEDASKVVSISRWFSSYNISTFDEFKYFTGLNCIDDFSFYWCIYLQSIKIPDSVKRIGGSAFYKCCKLKTINIPDKVKFISKDAFIGCNMLDTMFISKNCPVYNDMKKRYRNMEIVEPKVNESSNLGLNKHAQNKFNDVDTVDNVAYIQFEDPEVERICHEHGVYTYEDAANVTSIFDGNEGSIKSGWFRKSNIKSFKEFKYFKGLKEIYGFAFTGCKELSILSIPENVRIIRQYSLSDCPLKELVIYSRNLESIEYRAVNNDDRDIYISKECPAYEEFYNMAKGPRRHHYYEYAKFNIFDLSQYKDSQALEESKSIGLGLNKYAKKQHSSENIETTAEELVYSLDNPEDTKKSIAYKIIDLIPENWYIYSWIDEFIQIVSPAFDGEADTCPLGIITFSYEDLPLVNINFEGLDFTIKLTYDKTKNAEILEDCISKISTLIENLKTRKRHRNFGWWRKNDSEGKELRQMNKMNKNKVKMLIMNNEKRMD